MVLITAASNVHSLILLQLFYNRHQIKYQQPLTTLIFLGLVTQQKVIYITKAMKGRHGTWKKYIHQLKFVNSLSDYFFFSTPRFPCKNYGKRVFHFKKSV